MNEPPPYPRVAHLVSGRGTPDDEVLTSSLSEKLLHAPLLVEEKLDGANVAVWLDDSGSIQSALRSGLGGQDRGRQLGPLRAWLFERADRMRDLLAEHALYG